MSTNIYLLRRKDAIGYDEYDAKVIRANSTKRAREIACEDTGDEGSIWMDDKLVTCEVVVAEGPEGEILSSFNAG